MNYDNVLISEAWDSEHDKTYTATLLEFGSIDDAIAHVESLIADPVIFDDGTKGIRLGMTDIPFDVPGYESAIINRSNPGVHISNLSDWVQAEIRAEYDPNS